MDQHSPRREDDLSEIELRLASWQPSTERLDTDAMLFAAGRAAGWRGRTRLLWPALCAFLAVQAAGLGAWGLSERAERLALADRPPERAPTPTAPAPTAVAVLPEASYTPSPNDYLHLRRRVEQDSGRWLVSAQPAGGKAPGPPTEPAILSAGQRYGLIDQ